MKRHSHTISGLLLKRAELLGEAKNLKARLATISNTVKSLDEVLREFGHEGDLSAMRPKGVNRNGFARNKLRRFLLDELRKAKEPATIRALTEAVMRETGKDALDLRLVQDTVRKVRRALQTLERQGVLRSWFTDGARAHSLWRLTAASSLSTPG